MSNSNILTIGSLFYIILLIIVYFSKKRIKSLENKIYSMLLVSNFIGIILAILCYFTVLNYEKMVLINYIVSRLYLVYLVTFIFLFFIYLIVLIEKNNKQKKYNICIKMFGIIELFIILLIYILPLEYENINGVYSYGPSANVVYILATICMVIWTILIFMNRRNVLLKKLVPIAIFILGAMITTIIQKINPSLLLMTSMESFVIFLMYFTIENPDVSMLNELYKNKELMEQNYIDKYNFLFEMTQEARNPLVSISSICNSINKDDDKETIKKSLMQVNSLVKQLDFSINNILNISSLDVQKLKIVESRFNLEKLCNDLVTTIKPEVRDNVTLNVDVPKNIPILYGDYMKLRQILYSILINACKNTLEGNITLKVNLIEKYDVARVIFNISDTGSGMSIDKINEIIGSTGELAKDELDNLEKKEVNIKVCQKVMKIMGGNLMIKSKIGEGTDVILTIDERVYHEKEKSILSQYENAISDYRKALVISQDKEINNKLKKRLIDNKIAYTNLYYGMDAYDRIKAGKKFDFILVEDEMKEMSGFMTLKKLQEVKDFDIPVIIMLKEDKEHIKKHYLEDGFSDYLLINNLDSEIERIIEKY